MNVVLIVRAAAQPLPIVRCPYCHRRLFDGQMVGEIACPKCGKIVKFGRPVP